MVHLPEWVIRAQCGPVHAITVHTDGLHCDWSCPAYFYQLCSSACNLPARVIWDSRPQNEDGSWYGNDALTQSSSFCLASIQLLNRQSPARTNKKCVKRWWMDMCLFLVSRTISLKFHLCYRCLGRNPFTPSRPYLQLTPCAYIVSKMTMWNIYTKNISSLFFKFLPVIRYQTTMFFFFTWEQGEAPSNILSEIIFGTHTATVASYFVSTFPQIWNQTIYFFLIHIFLK